MRLTISLTGLVALLTSLLLTACATAPALTPGSTHVVISPNGLPVPDPVAVYDSASEYRIGPLDLLTIGVFQVTELSNLDLRVNASGDITLPLIGNVRAGGKTVVELQHAIAAKLSDGYLQSPQVSVFIKEYTSQRVTVDGAVVKPGMVPLTGATTLLEVIAASGGLGELADSRIVVFRMIKGQKLAAVFDLKAIRHGAAEDPQIFGDDVVVVEISNSKSKLHAFTQMVPALGFFSKF